MAKQLELGDWGESVATTYLEEKGYRILERNWRHQRAEVDIIAMDQDILVFVEVKTRTSDHFGPPEVFVSPRKEKLLVRAAHAYMQAIQHDWEIRFDVISILYRSREDYHIEQIPDAFWPGSW